MKKIVTVICLLVLMALFTGCCLSHELEIVSETIATCEKDGEEIYKCTNCEYEKVNTITKKGHSYVERIIQEPSCTNEGLKNKECLACGKNESIVINKVDHSYEYSITKDPTLEEPGIKKGVCSICEDTTEIELPQLGSKENPGKVNIDDLVIDINDDIESAKYKYNEKWILITGEVTNAYSSAGMTGYYLYGDRGDSGLRVICWVDGDIHSGSVVGKTFTFLGQVREITTFNATEIGECQIISD